ncbi:disease resistance protein RPV1-like isoform X2 [Eucalyptus grandis]|uniref:disease resistance protein RPV1-like isoform X2 n=1 Tax=Eucalyptus grandis TaxID=71139 RepID=UPI00192EB8E8|nr:disease resistance protein RPV1-like isoform X2 [Eucalyptus grandis]
MKRKRDSPDAVTMSACVDDGNSSSGTEFEVFLSFRGPDTRLNFTDCLYHSLVKAGVRVFRDDEEIRKGKKIEGELLHAIESSKIYLPIFSRNYASSKWCLRELTHMLESSSKANDKVILPIFYDVNPDDVKLKTQLYLNALKKHQKKLSHDEVWQWREALTKVARIKGWDMKDKSHGEIINTIVDEVLTKLMKRMRNLPDHLVGIHGHVEAIMDMLNEGSCDVRYLVIHGMGGIGKTTLASVVFNKISNQFQGCSFLLDIRESTQQGRIVDLQKQLLLEILQGGSLGIQNSVDVGINTIRERFRGKKVLLVLDDVGNRDQLSKLAGKSDWFGPGSRIIITTRDINFLPIKGKDKESSFQAHSQEFQIYKMTEMDSFHARQLFIKHAFRMDLPPHDFVDISRQITTKTGGLPLALEVIGASLYRESKKFWKGTLQKLELVPNQEVFNKLKISYDMLEPHQREIFLDIACFFIGEDRLHPYYMWKASNYFPTRELPVLTRMSLIKNYDRLWMHDQLRDLGREIVQREDINFPGKHSRLWEPKIAFDVVRMKEMSENLKVIEINSESGLKRIPDFSKCLNLKRLVIRQSTNLLAVDGSLSKLEHLKHLEIISNGFLKRDDCNLCPVYFVFGSLISLSNLQIRGMRLRELHHPIGGMICLKHLSLDNRSLLRTLPNSIGNLKMLRTMSLIGTPIKKLPNTIGKLESLLELYLDWTKIKKLPVSIENLKKLREMSLTHTPIKKLPNQIGKLESLLELYLDWTKIKKLPVSIENLKKLREMGLAHTPIKKLPNQIGGLESLLRLRLQGTDITELPASIGDLKRLTYLCLDKCAIRELPKAIGMLKKLVSLDVRFCENMEEAIPSEIGDLSFLRALHLTKSKIKRLPPTMSKLSHLQILCLDQCDELEQLPELPVSLKKLKISSHLLWTALDLTYLTNLDDLHIWGDTPRLSEFKQGVPKIEWIEGLSNLRTLTIVVGDVTFPPINLATLSRLCNLEITCVVTRSLMGLPSGLRDLTLYDLKSPMGRSLFSNLRNLFWLSLVNCRPREVEFDDVLGQQLKKLCFSHLKNGCLGLMETRGLEKLESLEALSFLGCDSLKELPDLSKLKKLRSVDVPDHLPEKLVYPRLPDTWEEGQISCDRTDQKSKIYRHLKKNWD